MPAMPAKTKTATARRTRVATTVATEAVALPPAEDTQQAALTVALERAFQMTPEDAMSVAEVVVEHFAGQREVNDETIDAEVRSLFYTLEGRRILAFRREEYENAEGQKRRAFYWRIRPEVVAELAQPTPEPSDADVYAQLPAECWSRGVGGAAAAEA